MSWRQIKKSVQAVSQPAPYQTDCQLSDVTLFSKSGRRWRKSHKMALASFATKLVQQYRGWVITSWKREVYWRSADKSTHVLQRHYNKAELPLLWRAGCFTKIVRKSENMLSRLAVHYVRKGVKQRRATQGVERCVEVGRGGIFSEGRSRKVRWTEVKVSGTEFQNIGKQKSFKKKSCSRRDRNFSINKPVGVR